MPGIPFVLREYCGPAKSRPAASWKHLQLAGGAASATVSCPGCGCVATLEDHTIAADGQVQPSLLCPHRCGFYDHVLLKNWGNQ